MKLLKTKREELDPIMKIITEAQQLLAAHNIDQWQNGYPNEETILKDIDNNESYIIRTEDSRLIGTAMFSTRKEPNYSAIEGNWKTKPTATYGVIHRMAVTERFRGKGVAKFIFSQCELFLLKNNVHSMRIDTHEDNLGMQQLLKKLGYAFCGIIYLENGDKRLAYEKNIK
jgi:GNAT superfamily N-acetyltransferase|tara:strand:+ start:28845 stop:29357 length:513 start_codon:yes stop_codon:yes gene_type:complete